MELFPRLETTPFKSFPAVPYYPRVLRSIARYLTHSRLIVDGMRCRFDRMTSFDGPEIVWDQGRIYGLIQKEKDSCLAQTLHRTALCVHLHPKYQHFTIGNTDECCCCRRGNHPRSHILRQARRRVPSLQHSQSPGPANDAMGRRVTSAVSPLRGMWAQLQINRGRSRWLKHLKRSRT